MKRKKHPKTNVVRLLEKEGISHEVLTYEVDESDLGAGHVADSIGFPHARVFKTLVARCDNGAIVLACIPGDRELDLKALAAAHGSKKADLVPVREIQGLTGYVRGGVSPVVIGKSHPVYLDESAWQWESISVSAGARGIQMVVHADGLARVADVRRAVVGR